MLQRLTHWHDCFFKSRQMQQPDGRHLYAYNISTTEFSTLKEILSAVLANTAHFSKTPLDYWNKDKIFCSSFVLYASRWWQEFGSELHWQPIINPIYSVQTPQEITQIGQIISCGLKFWLLPQNVYGLRHLGAIAREAGLPLALLTQSRGKIGEILHRLLGETLKRHADRPTILQWLAVVQEQLPKTYRNESIKQLLTDFVLVAADIKKELQATTPETALAELNEKAPRWRERFPLPLYAAGAQNLLEKLIGNIASDHPRDPKQLGNPIIAIRYLSNTGNINEWSLKLKVELHNPVQPLKEFATKMPRLLSMRVVAGTKNEEGILRKYNQEAAYMYQGPTPTFKGQTATQQILIQFCTPSGEQFLVDCDGGDELDETLPWIFEGEGDREFRQQGGGKVKSASMLVVLSEGWKIEPDPQSTCILVGRLADTERTVWEIRGTGQVIGENERFRLQTACLDVDGRLVWVGEKALGLLSKPQTFLGVPKPAFRTKSGLKLLTGQIFWKAAGKAQYRPADSNTFGVGNLMFKDSSGQYLRNKVLILPPTAKLHIEPQGPRNGTIVFSDWGAVKATVETPNVVSSTQENNFSRTTLLFEAQTGCPPPENIRLRLSWPNLFESIPFEIPFPSQGARLFNANGNEIVPKDSISFSEITGKRLHLSAHHAKFAIQLSIDGKAMIYPLVHINSNMQVLSLSDWRAEITAMFGMAEHQDTPVRLTILENNILGPQWEITRYKNRLEHDDVGEKIRLQNSSNVLDDDCAEICILALPLIHPEKDPITLSPITDDEANAKVWALNEAILSDHGPWFIYDKSAKNTIRPVLWWDDPINVARTNLNLLQEAILAPTDERPALLRQALEHMVEDASTTEWQTFAQLTQKLSHLPLSALDVWKESIKMPFFMATLALRPDIDFQKLTSRTSIELPFLWETIPLVCWEKATQHLKNWCLLKIDKNENELFELLFNMRRNEIDNICPPSGLLLKFVYSTDDDLKMLDAIKSHFTLEKVNDILFSRENSRAQQLMQYHADEEWPEDFSSWINSLRQQNNRYNLLPNMRHYDSILFLPVILAKIAFFGFLNDLQGMTNQRIFAVRIHKNFDQDWFDDAFCYTLYGCFANANSI